MAGTSSCSCSDNSSGTAGVEDHKELLRSRIGEVAFFYRDTVTNCRIDKSL